MKSNFLDKLIGVFSPEAENKRLRARARREMLQRAYDAASTFRTEDWSSATKGSANAETRGAQATLRAKGRDLVRNNPYGVRILNSIVTNTVGSGIVPKITGKNRIQTRRLREAWKEWAETTLCDANGKLNFYGMQNLVMRSVVESGEVLVLKEINKDFGMQLRLLESDHIDSYKENVKSKTESDQVIQGVKLDASGRVKSYFVYESHPGDYRYNTETREVSADKVCHVYRQDRPGQVRGVSWFHAVIRQLSDLNEFIQTTLINRKVSACYMAFITTNDSDSTLSASDLIAKREAENMMSPGQVRYLANGEQVQLASPPALNDFEQFVRQAVRMICSGMNIPYSAGTSDFSQENFSSGRMARIEFKKSVEDWQWNMLIPQFCEPAFQHFLEWARIAKGIQTEGSSCQWVTPVWALLDPTKEIDAMSSAVRSGFTTYRQAVLELGYDPDQHLEEIAEDNAKLDELEIVLDIDPRKTTKQGQFQVVTASNDNGENPSEDKKDNEDDADGSSQVDS